MDIDGNLFSREKGLAFQYSVSLDYYNSVKRRKLLEYANKEKRAKEIDWKLHYSSDFLLCVFFPDDDFKRPKLIQVLMIGYGTLEVTFYFYIVLLGQFVPILDSNFMSYFI